MSYALLGKIPFNTNKNSKDPFIVFEGHNNFTSYTEEDEANYAIHQLINTKAKLQPTGLELKKVSFELQLRQEFIDIGTAIELIREIREGFLPVPLIWGNGEVVGDFVITKTSKEINYQYNDGAIVGATLSIELLEYHYEDGVALIQKEEQKQRTEAKAVGKKKSVTKPRENKNTCSQDVSLYIRYMKTNGATLTAVQGKLTMLPEKSHVPLRNILDAANQLKELPCVTQDMKDYCVVIANQTQVVSAIFTNNQNNPSSPNLVFQENEIRTLNRQIDSLERASSGLITKTITRNG